MVSVNAIKRNHLTAKEGKDCERKPLRFISFDKEKFIERLGLKD